MGKVTPVYDTVSGIRSRTKVLQPLDY